MSYVNVQARKLPFFLRYLADLIAYRHLFWNLIGSDLRSRFRRTRLGILWAVIQPLVFALTIAFVWGALARAANYWEFALYVFTGHIAFELFGAAFMAAQDSVSGAVGYLRQARIPFFIFQIRPIFTGVVILFFGIIGFFIFAASIGAFPRLGEHLLLVPLFIPIYVAFLMPIAILMSIAGLLFRDVKHISALVSQAVFLLSPVMLPREIFDQPNLWFMEFINPMVPLLDLFRDPILYSRLWEAQDLMVIGIWIVGLWAIALITAASVGRKLVYAI